MTDAHTADLRQHPLHSLFSWPAVIAGAVVAVTVGAMLNFLGVALGAASLDPYEMSGGEAEGFTAAAGMWMVLANAIALFIGGAVASRAAKYADHHKGALHGLGVWAVAFLLALFIASSTVAGGLTAILGGEAERASSDNTVVADVLTRDGADGERADALPAIEAEDRAAADNAADTTAAIALWAFLAMLIGAATAIFGGIYGTRRHAWLAKAGLTDGRSEDTLPRKI